MFVVVHKTNGASMSHGDMPDLILTTVKLILVIVELLLLIR